MTKIFRNVYSTDAPVARRRVTAADTLMAKIRAAADAVDRKLARRGTRDDGARRIVTVLPKLDGAHYEFENTDNAVRVIRVSDETEYPTSEIRTYGVTATPGKSADRAARAADVVGEINDANRRFWDARR